MIAKLEIECKNPEIVLKSLKPDLDDTEKFKVDLKVKENKLVLIIEAKELSGLLAGINSYARLIKASTDVVSI